MSDYFIENQTKTEFRDNSSWVILSSIEQSIKRKIEEIGTPLKDWDVNIYRGILTGYNEAFIISGEKRTELLAACETEKERIRTDELIRPILRGRDIKRYNYEFADLWLINTHNGVKDKGVSGINIDDYPSIKMHLDKYWDNISVRADKGDTPYNLRNCAYMDDFNKQKIVWIELTDHPNFALDENGYFINNTVFFMTGENLKYILAFLNSKICEWYFDKICATSGVGTRRWIKMYIDQIRLPQVPKDYMLNISTLVNLKDETSINLAFYDIFLLTQQEIEIVEGN